jgi:PAS domain S-box-containing protein
LIDEIKMDEHQVFTHSLNAFLDSLGIASLFLDNDARTIGWNSEFLRLFPEQAGHIHKDEPYAENLRRFYSVRLDAAEMLRIEFYVAAGVERHTRQVEPFEFLHRGRWLRASILPVPGVGRLRAWTSVRSPKDCERLAGQMAHSGGHSALSALEEIPDGIVVRTLAGRITLCNRRFAEIYGLRSPEEAVGRTLSDLLEIAWTGSAHTDAARQIWSDVSRFIGAPFDLELPSDRWVRVRDYRSFDDVVVSTHVDVTSIVRLQRSAAEARRQAEELEARLQVEVEERKQTDARTARIGYLAALGSGVTGLRNKVGGALLYTKGVVDHINAEKGLTYIATGPVAGVGFPHRRFPEAVALVPGEVVEIGRVDPQGPPLDWRPAPRCKLPGLFEKAEGRLERKPGQVFALITCATYVVFVPADIAAAFEPGWAGDVSCWAIKRASRNGRIGWRAVTPPCRGPTVTA